MNNFGKIKSKLLKKLTEAYTDKTFKQNTKNLFKVIKKNRDFKEMYLFYEEIENKYFEDKETAKLYVEQLGQLLKEKATKINNFCQVINMSVHDTQIDENKLYDSIDQLLEAEHVESPPSVPQGSYAPYLTAGYRGDREMFGIKNNEAIVMTKSIAGKASNVYELKGDKFVKIR